jgi:hypothetical protein
MALTLSLRSARVDDNAIESVIVFILSLNLEWESDSVREWDKTLNLVVSRDGESESVKLGDSERNLSLSLASESDSVMEPDRVLSLFLN